jgi:hypothetical protein
MMWFDLGKESSTEEEITRPCNESKKNQCQKNAKHTTKKIHNEKVLP